VAALRPPRPGAEPDEVALVAAAAPDWETLADVARSCVACPELAATRQHVVVGDVPVSGRPLVVFVGEAPGATEDATGRPFVGRSGALLDQLLAEAGLDRAETAVLNVVKCRPPGNRDPRPDEIASCRPYLESQLDLIEPRVVVTLGNFAARLLLETTDGITRLRGQVYPFRTGVLIPTFHPAAALRGGGQVMAQMRADLIRAKRALADDTAGPP
jgi:uracil-DNA glycosylase